MKSELTPMQWRIARYVAEGLTNIEIGERIGISKYTVAMHLKHIYDRLCISSRTQLAAWVGRQEGKRSE